MRRRSRRLFDRAMIAVVALGAVLLIAGGFAMLHNGGSSSSPESNPSATPILPSDSDDETSDSRPTPTATTASPKLSKLPGFGGGSNGTHAYAFSIGDTKLHTVTLTINTDGRAYLGYQFRNGQPHKVLGNSSFSITQRLHGPSPIAQIAGQVVGDATYTSCAIYIDGKKAISHTVHGLNNIAFCGA